MPGYDELNAFRSFSWDLSPDGKEIAFAANVTEPPWQKLNFDLFLLSVDGEEGGLRNITSENPADDGSPRSSRPDGRYLLFGRTHRPEISPDFTRLARYDRQTGEIRELAAEWDHEPSGWRVTRDGSTVVFTAQDRGRSNLYKLPIAGGEPQLLVTGGAIGGVREAASGQLVFLQESFHRPDDLYAVSLAGGESQRLTSFNDELLAQIDFGTVEDVTFEGAAGDPVQMHVLFPPASIPPRNGRS